jgi:hypothetical protein
VVELPAGVDDVAVADLAREHGLGPLALSRLRLLPGGDPGLVLGYAAHSPDELTSAVCRLAGLIDLQAPDRERQRDLQAPDRERQRDLQAPDRERQREE